MNVPAPAVRLAARGIPSFPVLENKAPACPLGFKAATCGVDGMKALGGRWPGPLVGVVTRAASGFDVLDIDPRHGGNAWLSAHLDRLPTTRLHITRSGGQHLLFRHADGVRNTASRIAPGVDTRGDGGFIVYWPAEGLPVTVREPLAA